MMKHLSSALADSLLILGLTGAWYSSVELAASKSMAGANLWEAMSACPNLAYKFDQVDQQTFGP
jgi:hypothetical protein